MRTIEPFKEGDTRTPLSASAMNELVTLLNMLGGMREGKGIRLHWAQSGLTIELDDFVQNQLLMTGDGQGGDGNGEQGPGTLKWRGAWAAATSYQRNDIVYLEGGLGGDGKGQLVAGEIGTFICIKDIVGHGSNDEPGFLPDSKATHPGTWAPFTQGDMRYRGFWSPAQTYRRNDVVQVPRVEGTYVSNAGLYMAVTDVPSDGASPTDGTTWLRLENSAWTSPIFPTQALIGTDANNIAIVPSALTLTLGSVATTGIGTAGMSCIAVGASLTLGPVGGNRIIADTAALTGAESISVQSVTYKNAAGNDETRKFLCTGVI